MSFPFLPHCPPLGNKDLDLLAPLFARSIKAFCPCAAVYLVGPEISGDGLPGQWKAGIEVVRNGLQPVKGNGCHAPLYLPLWSQDALCGVAVLTGVEMWVLDLAAATLLDKSRLISRELALVKEGALDPQTGFGNVKVLQARLAALCQGAGSGTQELSHCLLLVEIFPKGRDAGHALAEVSRAGAYLESLIGHLAPPCHLGNGLFALLWEGVSADKALKVADQLLQWLKRENIPKAHIGISEGQGGRKDPEEILEEAWLALQTAYQRGPFGLCSFRSVANRASHPLYPPPRQITARLNKEMKGLAAFALVELGSDGEPGPAFAREILAAVAGKEPVIIVVSAGRGYVLLPGCTEDAALEWCRQAKKDLVQEGPSYSFGVALFPCADFKRAEMVANSRKALVHTSFFGPGTFTVFDGVSLNISGDIYYNDGDMVKAAREYQRGLALDPKNVNLLNSYGVTLAQMARYAKAIPLFEEVLAIDRSNFMALCNLGFAHLARGQENKALVSFEEALAGQDDHFDLLLQLGKLYCRRRSWQEAVTVLTKAEKIGPRDVRDVSHGAVHRYLGEAHVHLGNRKQAMATLQRAIRHNPQDAASLSLLGELYSLEGQGGDIARTFCSKAVEVDGQEWRYWLRLARVELADGDLPVAHQAVKEALRLEREKGEIYLLLGEVFEGQHKEAAALKAYQRAVRLDGSDKRASQAVKRLISR
ncbi:MAG: tetratricopeptide repeat protein [Deltaproteobacteria bacterium]|jgi:tetratricopeptide (TPR) repeat protein|nr:tetratricopeptide repeat protein [Deltaproteobacteria bacterium]